MEGGGNSIKLDYQETLEGRDEVDAAMAELRAAEMEMEKVKQRFLEAQAALATARELLEGAAAWRETTVVTG